ncbi:MAG TPA: VTT domain-containing protein [Bryobacteraceae bacterium]|nr:VTT domain-containing protein [Bryobacteraceae bacterium]
MNILLLQRAHGTRSGGLTATFRHLGALGLFFLAVLDSSPVPTFGGPDILIAILAGSHRDPWYEYVAAATAGSVLGAWLTFRIARRAGSAYLRSKFGQGRVSAFLRLFQRQGTGTLIASTAVPFPFPTSLVFAAAGASDYPLSKYISIVMVCRVVRYSIIAIIADLYGRHFIRVLSHPLQYWGWFLTLALVVVALASGGMWIHRRLSDEPTA